MKKVKEFLAMIPATVWIGIAIIVLFGVYWFSSDIGNWWEKRKQEQFDEQIAAKQVEIDNALKQRDEAIRKAEEAESREQAKILEADLLRQEAAKHGVNVAEAQKKIDAALSEYQNDSEFIEKVRTGEVTNLQLCEKQCKDSAEQGYPCRPTYCDKFK